MAKPPKQSSDVQVRLLQAKLDDRNREIKFFRDELKKLNTRLEHFIGQMNHEIKIAHKIQSALVPTEIPTIPGFSFSRKYIASGISGGDYFDIFEHEDKYRFGIMVAASSGFGMSALFLSVLLKLSGPLAARRNLSTLEILGRIAKELSPEMRESDSAHLFYGIVDRRTFEMSYTSAGNIFVYHYAFGKKELSRVTESNNPVTANEKIKFEEGSLLLNSRDRLFILTPGALLCSKNGEPLTVNELDKILKTAISTDLHEARNEIVYQLQKRAGTKELPRDLSVVVVEVKDHVIKLAKR